MHQTYTPFGVRVLGNLTAEPATKVTLKILRRTGCIIVLAAPEVLLGEGDKLQIAVLKRVVDARELRTNFRLQIKRRIGIEVIRIVQQRRVVVIAVGRNDRHTHNHRPQHLLKPALPLPLTVVVCACIDEIAGEHAEPRVPFVTSHRLGTQTCGIDIFLVLNMTVGHIDETELSLLLILRAEVRHVAPVAGIPYAPRIIRTGAEVLRQRLVAHIAESSMFVQTRSFQQSGC